MAPDMVQIWRPWLNFHKLYSLLFYKRQKFEQAPSSKGRRNGAAWLPRKVPVETLISARLKIGLGSERAFSPAKIAGVPRAESWALKLLFLQNGRGIRGAL